MRSRDSIVNALKIDLKIKRYPIDNQTVIEKLGGCGNEMCKKILIFFQFNWVVLNLVRFLSVRQVWSLEQADRIWNRSLTSFDYLKLNSKSLNLNLSFER